jgi:hypothetical protein
MQKIQTIQKHFNQFLDKTLERLDKDIFDKFRDDRYSICIDLNSTLSKSPPDIIREYVRQYFTKKIYPSGTLFDVHVNPVSTRNSIFLFSRKSGKTQVFIAVNSHE